jgi:2-polyprenyl-3-methyl-5-hydroxy-6-metoxy-1,4-benzoquinol methylase
MSLADAADALLLERARRLRDRLVERAPRAAERLYRRADAIANLPFRGEEIEPPPPLELNGHRIDVIADLADYTALPRELVVKEVSSRTSASFRAEWHATPEPLRHDHWYYLSSKGYLFANAVHFPDTSFADDYVVPHTPAGGRVLDFGAGTGNLALALAALGLDVWAAELNALQREFIRFRVARYGLDDRVTVAEPWAPLPASSFAAIVAVDVLEHLPDCRATLERQLLPALAPDGVLVENSPFVVNSANPMHHHDFGFEPFMEAAGFELVERAPDITRVWRRRR